MLYHHDQREYGVAAEKAVSWAREKLERMVSTGRKRTVETLQAVQDMQIDDRVVPSSRVQVISRDGYILTDGSTIGSEDMTIEPHALNQIIGRIAGTKKVTDWCYTPDTADEFASIINKKMAKLNKTLLLRSVGNDLRGVMSDRYRRLDNRPMLQALVETAIQDHGAVPIDAKMQPTNFHVKMVLPRIYEPVPNEIGVFGLTFRNSDFGKGRLYAKGFFNRLWCTNLAMTEDGISQVHLGSKLSEEIQFSQRTYELDTQLMASAIKDVVEHIFSEENIGKRISLIQEAHAEDEKLDIGKVLKGITGASSGSKLVKSEAEKVAEAFNSAEIRLLPPGNTKWRLSNAISLIAQEAKPDRQLEMESLAGSVAGMHLAVA